MKGDCEDLNTGGLIERYTKHPASLEHLTPVDWATWYNSLFYSCELSCQAFNLE